MTRILLVTGKGGVGKTSIAAATAASIATEGDRVLLTSTDPAHSLSDALVQPLADEPTTVHPPSGWQQWSRTGSLDAQQIDAQARLEARWGTVRRYLTDVLVAGGSDEVQAEELVLFPGLDELFSLIDLLHHSASGRYDVIVVDCAPTAETLRLLALPEAIGWYSGRAAGLGRALARAARVLWPGERGGPGGAIPAPSPGVFATADQLYSELAAVHDRLQDPTRSSIRLVTNPERLVVSESMRTATSLSLFGYGIDAVIANRVLPDVVEDPYLARWHDRQAQHLRTLDEAFAPIPVRQVPLLTDEPSGLHDLLGLARHVYPDGGAAQVLHASEPTCLSIEGQDRILTIALPFVTTDDLQMHRKGDELHLKVAGVRRRFMLPDQLRGAAVIGARLVEGCLAIRMRIGGTDAAEAVAPDEGVAG